MVSLKRKQSMETMRFGSSFHQLSGQYQVWYFDAEENTVIPLAAYTNVERSKVAAFEIAHAAGKGEDPEQAKREIFANADGAVTAFTLQEQELLKALAADTLANGEPQVQRGVSMRIRTTPYDQVFVVVFG
jgi:hypothetical protein